MKNNLDYIDKKVDNIQVKKNACIGILCIIICILVAVIILQNSEAFLYEERLEEIVADDVEIEKKWLINPQEIPFDLSDAKVFQIEQTYINFSPEMRVRNINQGEQYVFALKYDMTEDGMQRTEVEIVITQEEYEALVSKKSGNTIYKTRYQLMVDGELVAIDIFHGDLEGLAYMEIEFPNMEEAQAFEEPEWVVEDVTDNINYKNGYLARYGIPAK